MMTERSTLAGSGFSGDGEMQRAVRNKDWSATLLGPMAGWLPCMRTAVGLCLDSPFQVMLLLGPELVYIYNDAAIAIFGDKHPFALGQRAADVWPESWSAIAPLLDTVLAGGRSLREDDWLLVLNRSGFVEECYFTLSINPILTDGGAAAGVFVAAMETTRRVLNERRQRTLQDLATQVALRRGDAQTLARVHAALAANPYDMPLSALYLAVPGAAYAEQVFCSGLHGHCAGIAKRIAWSDVDADAGEHPLARLARSFEQQLYAADALLAAADTCGIWPEAPRQILALPFTAPGYTTPRGFLLVALNPRAALDQEYRQFIATVVGLVATAVAGVAALAAEQALVQARRDLEQRFDLRTAELRDANRLLAAVFDRAPGGIALIDTDGCFVRANPAYQALVGYSEQALIGSSITSITVPEDAAAAAAQLAPLLAGAIDSSQMEVRARRADGSVIWVHNFVSLIEDEQRRPRYFVRIATDITERKRVDAERRAAQQELNVLYERLQTVREAERTALAREVHDQLGQALSAAKIDLRLLEDALLLHGATLAPEKIITEVRSACATLNHAMQLVREIATELRAPELDGQGLYAAIAWHARDFERRTRIRVQLALGAGLAQPARPAAEALLRIFQEAISNVLRHAHASQVWVRVERRADALLLRVRDDGAGIARRRAGGVVGSLGITGMRERAALAGGRLTVGPLRTGGTLVSALIRIDGIRLGSAA